MTPEPLANLRNRHVSRFQNINFLDKIVIKFFRNKFLKAKQQQSYEYVHTRPYVAAAAAKQLLTPKPEPSSGPSPAKSAQLKRSLSWEQCFRGGVRQKKSTKLRMLRKMLACRLAPLEPALLRGDFHDDVCVHACMYLCIYVSMYNNNNHLCIYAGEEIQKRSVFRSSGADRLRDYRLAGVLQ